MTLLRIYKKDKATGQPVTEPEAIRSWEKKLMHTCADAGTKFVSYRPDGGVWKFDVEHFSRYAAPADSDEDETPQPPAAGIPMDEEEEEPLAFRGIVRAGVTPSAPSLDAGIAPLPAPAAGFPSAFADPDAGRLLELRASLYTGAPAASAAAEFGVFGMVGADGSAADADMDLALVPDFGPSGPGLLAPGRGAKLGGSAPTNAWRRPAAGGLALEAPPTDVLQQLVRRR